MAAIHPRELRQRIADAVLEQLGGGARNWVQSAYGYYASAPTDSSSHVARSFRVGVLASVADDPTGRQRASVGVMCTTTVGVRWSAQIPTNDPHGGIDDALDDEVDLVDAVLGMRRLPGLGALRLDAIDRTTDDDGTTFEGELTFLVRHFYPRRAR
mgnify:CR=1 FL=1